MSDTLGHFSWWLFRESSQTPLDKPSAKYTETVQRKRQRHKEKNCVHHFCKHPLADTVKICTVIQTGNGWYTALFARKQLLLQYSKTLSGISVKTTLSSLREVFWGQTSELNLITLQPATCTFNFAGKSHQELTVTVILFVNVHIYVCVCDDDRVIRLPMWLPARRIGQRHQSRKPPQCRPAGRLLALCVYMRESERDRGRCYCERFFIYLYGCGLTLYMVTVTCLSTSVTEKPHHT